MVIERRRWVRGLLISQPAISWPCSWWAWSGGDAVGLTLAVVLLWTSALLCVYAIVAPLRREQDQQVLINSDLLATRSVR